LKSIKEIKQSLNEIKVPEPWEAHFSEKYGRIYYFNPITKESVWECPATSRASEDASERQGDHHVDDSSHTASSVSRAGGKIEDHLLRKGEEYQQKREELRIKKENEMKAEITGRPQLSKYAEKIPHRDVDNIAERASNMLKQKKEKEDALRREKELKEQCEVTAQPEINKRSQHLHRSVDDMLSWEEARRAKIEAKQLELERQKQSEVSATPVTVTSKAITEKLLKNRKSKTSEGVPVSMHDYAFIYLKYASCI
jgi:hypothetical protein